MERISSYESTASNLLIGCSVTQRVKTVKQPRGGYIKPKSFTQTALGEGIDALNANENIPPNMVGSVVDYLTRVATGAPVSDAFCIAIKGASILAASASKGLLNGTDLNANAAQQLNKEAATAIATANNLVTLIKGLDDASIAAAVQLTHYDTVYRAGIPIYVKGWKPLAEIAPDAPTIENIRIMVERATTFFDAYGPKVLDGFTLTGGYTPTVSSGDGDFTTSDTLWDFKTSKLPIKKEQTLQLLMYWRMGLRSVHSEFKAIKYLGIFNPRTNVVSRLAVADIPVDIINTVDRDVIGYDD